MPKRLKAILATFSAALAALAAGVAIYEATRKDE